MARVLHSQSRPTLQELSPGTSRFPGGEVVYIYGSLLFDYLSRNARPGSIRDFVERGSKTPSHLAHAGIAWRFRNVVPDRVERWRDSLI